MYCIILYCIDGVVIAALMHCRLLRSIVVKMVPQFMWCHFYCMFTYNWERHVWPFTCFSYASVCLCVPFVWRSLQFFSKSFLFPLLFLCYPYCGIFISMWSLSCLSLHYAKKSVNYLFQQKLLSTIWTIFNAWLSW